MLRLQWAFPVGLGTPASNSRRETADRLTRSWPTHWKNVADHLGLLLDHLEAGDATSSPAAHIAVAIRRSRQHAHASHVRQVALATAAAFEHPGPLILSKHALEMQEQIIFRGLADRPVEEHDLSPRAGKLLEQDRLVGIRAGQTVRGVHIDNIDGRHRDQVAQALQTGPNQAGPALAIIQEAELLADVTAVGGRPRQQIAHLAADRLLLSLLVRGDTRVDGCPCRKEQLVRLDRVCRLILHRAPPSTALSGSGKPDARAPAEDARRPA